MRVLVSPGAGSDPLGRSLAGILAGTSEKPVFLDREGVSNLRRPLSKAEVYILRRVLLGCSAGEALKARPDREAVVGYVCRGRDVSPRTGLSTYSSGAVRIIDHVNLGVLSPLIGPNADELGPRFPVTAGLYSAVGPDEDLPAVVAACVTDEDAPTAWELEMMESAGLSVATSELCPVALLAAHLGCALAATIVLSDAERGRASVEEARRSSNRGRAHEWEARVRRQ